MGILKLDSSKDPSIAAYLTLPAMVKLFHLLLGVICLWIACHDLWSNFQDLIDSIIPVVSDHTTGGLFSSLAEIIPIGNINHLFIDQLTSRITFVIAMGVLLLISSIQYTWFAESLVTGPMKCRIISGVIYHLFGFGLHLVATLFLSMRIDILRDDFRNVYRMRKVVIIAHVNAALYLLSAILALCTLLVKRVGQKSSFREGISAPFSKLSEK